MTPQNTSAIANFPMGPHTRQWLDISNSAYSGEQNANPSSTEVVNFSEFVLNKLSESTPSNVDRLVDILEEFVGMNLPLLAIKLVDANPCLFPDNDFRAQLHLGNAAMLVGDLSRAELAFSAAQKLIPEEPAPYVNLTQIYCHDGLIDNARKWCLAGLNVDPNHLRLWELLAWIEQESLGRNEEGNILCANSILALAKKLNSWAGLSLHCDLVAQEDVLAKTAILERFWNEGNRNADFLIEFTALLGLAGKYDRIPSIVWQFEKELSAKADKTAAPWQLYLHLTQAYLGLGRDDDARASLDKINKYNNLPESAKQALAIIREELPEISNIH